MVVPPVAWWFDLLQIVAALGAVLAVVHVRTAYFARRAGARATRRRTNVVVHGSQQRLETLAYIDNLNMRRTGACLATRLTTSSRVLRAGTKIAPRCSPISSIVEAVNDTCGRAAGDAVLVEARRWLCAAVRASDRVARLGGDEFAILLGPDRDDAGTGRVFRRLVERFTQPVVFGEAGLSTSPIIGIAVYLRDGPHTRRTLQVGRSRTRRCRRRQPASLL